MKNDRNERNQEAKAIAIDRLHAFRDHPYKVKDNAEMDELTESVRANGILTPVIVRPLEGTENEYEIISGHRRVRAAQKAGLTEVPAFVFDISREEAAVLLVDSNLHRERLLPSEKAFAYRMKLEALSHQGKACGQVGHKSRDDVSDTDSGRQIQRYIHLTYLIPELLDLMDEGKIAFSVGVELSYLPPSSQREVLEAMHLNDCTPSYSQAVRMRKQYIFGTLDRDSIESILAEEKPNQQEHIRLKRDDYARFFPRSYTPAQIERDIQKGLELLKRQRERNRDCR